MVAACTRRRAHAESTATKATDEVKMDYAQALLQAYRTGDVMTIAEAEKSFMNAALAAYGDVGSLRHGEPPGYAERFERVMDEMAAIEAAAKVAA